MTTTHLTMAVLLTALTATGYPTGGRDKQHASWDEMNVVAHGLLQLGQALKEHVDKSKVQMRELNAGLRSMNETLRNLEMERGTRLSEASGAKGNELSDRVERLEQRVEEVENIQTPHIGGVRPRTFSLGCNTASHLTTRMMAAQNRRIDQLMEKIKQQQDKLEKQSVHLQALQIKKQPVKPKQCDQSGSLTNSFVCVAGFAKDCHELFVQGQRKTGVYTIQPGNSKPFSVLCEMTQAGGWTVIQKRFDGSQSFDLAWNDYRRGFGSLTGEFWLGLAHIHTLARQGRYMLQVELSDSSRQSHVISSEFQLEGEEGQFSLHLGPDSDASLGGLFSAAGSSGLPFSTPDRDNDLSAEDNCVGGSTCGDSNLNGEFPSSLGSSRSMFWTTSGAVSALRSTVMKIAPVSSKH
uniref:Fibrinogen C-terminal domain-containing protein n=1 Tax=Periophthalmus magnuspinnatus TaxID=409849 RepID=A0A3B4BAB7_9GOBI